MKLDDRGNILVIGKSGVGKSTVINAVLGEDRAKTGWGTTGTTEELEIYEGTEELRFRLIDTIGFEPSFLKEHQAISAVRKWSKTEEEEKEIHVIWYCVEGTSSKLFERDINSMIKATKIWKSVPIIVVITKSYSEEEQKKNVEMVQKVFDGNKNIHNRLKEIVPVVALPYKINQNITVPPSGILELIDITNDSLEEGKKAGKKDLENFKLKRRRAFAQSVVAASVTSGTIVGAVPIPIADTAILSPLEVAEMSGIAYIYGIHKDEESSRLFNSIIEVGTVSMAAKTVVSVLKAIPGINLGVSAVNALVAGGIIAAIGEGSIYIFEQIYLGKKKVSDIDWAKKVIESKLSSGMINKLIVLANQISDQTDKSKIAQIILDVFKISQE